MIFKINILLIILNDKNQEYLYGEILITELSYTGIHYSTSNVEIGAIKFQAFLKKRDELVNGC